MTAGSTRTTAWRLAFAIAAVGVVVFLFGLTVGLAFPGASNPLNPADGGQTTDEIRHTNPADLQEGGDLGALERRLASDIARQVESGALNLTQDDYEFAREQVGGENVDALLDEYNDVSSDDGGSSESGEQNRTSLLAQSQIALANYTEQVSAYWQLHERYEQLTGTGPYFGDSDSVTVRKSPQSVFQEVNESTARMLVAQLEQRAERVDQTAPDTIEAYEELSSTTEGNYTRTIEALERSRESVLETQAAIFEEQHTQTSLTIRANGSTVKATDTIELRGQFTEADGTPITTEELTLEIGEESFDVTTNATGWFALPYQSLLVERNTTELTVEYVPSGNSPYLSSETTINVTVEPVEVTLQAEPTTNQMRFNDTVSVTGYVFAQNQPLSNVPYTILVGGQPVAEDVTTADGLVDTQFEVPAAVEAGQQQLVVKLPNGTVLLSDDASSTVTVSSTSATMAINATAGDGNVIQVNGSLRTESDVPITGQLVDLSVDDQTIQTVITDANGSFDDELVVPASLVGGMEGTVTITVSAGFDATGTNLQSVSETTQLTAEVSNIDGNSGSDGGQQGDGQQGDGQQGDGQQGDGQQGDGQQGEDAGDGSSSTTLTVALLAVLAAGLVAGGYLVYRYRGSDESETAETDENEPTPESTETPTGSAFESGLAAAVDLLDSDRPEAAVRASYAALREGLTGTDDSSRIQTHWEFYQEYRERLDAETETKLRAVTEAYERVAFAGESADTDMARDVIDAVQSLGTSDEPVTDGGTEREEE
jgi:hypothetical protein